MTTSRRQARPALRRFALLASLVLAAATPGGAETAAGDGDRATAQAEIFAADAFAALPVGARLGFTHRRSFTPSDTRLPDIRDGRADLAIETDEAGKRRLRLSLTDDGAARPVPPFPADAGHPVLLIFLETTVRTMATLTGGNAYYIRNRIREALWDGGTSEAVTIDLAGRTVAGERTTIHPFADDPNRTRMGPFGALEMSFVLADTVPGRVMRLEAVAGAGDAGFRESFVFDAMEGAD